MVPSTGGIAIFTATVLPLLGGIIVVWAVPPQRWTGTFSIVGEHIEGLEKQTPLAVAVLIGMAVLHITGVFDDRRQLGPWLKLIIQASVAAALAVFFDMRVLHAASLLGPVGVLLSVLTSIVWILAITNAMNFLDNMDGLSGGVGAIIAGLYLAATLINGQWFVAALAALLLGALLGFLVFNFPSARVFMGDGGSLVVGFLLAVLSIRTTYVQFNTPEAGGSRATWYGLLMPVVVMAVPLYDLASVILIRLAQGRSPFVGDHQHFSHRLVAKGLSPRTAVMVIWLCTIATGLGGVMLGHLRWWQAMLVGIQVAAVIGVLALLEMGQTKDRYHNNA